MVKLKVFFVVGVVVSILTVCVFAPGVCIERFVLPDGCCANCNVSSEQCRTVCMIDESNVCVCP